MSQYNVHTNYPLIPNANEYLVYQKVVSIHSEDRDITKWANSSDFEIELPDDYINVSTVKLGSYTFPSNYNVFDLLRGNTAMTFQFLSVYNPSDYGYFDPIQNAIFSALQPFVSRDIVVGISEGFYTPYQMAKELTNRFNYSVNQIVIDYLNKNEPSLIDTYVSSGGYDQFVVIYNLVTQTLWFGNKSSSFVITNDSAFYILKNDSPVVQCGNANYKEFCNWGLPSYLGFARCPAVSKTNSIEGYYPQFFYGDALSYGDNGYWLTPDLGYKNKKVYFLEAPFKINLMGDAYFYLQIEGMNNIDETMPYSQNAFTATSNMTNGVHNSAFAKIAVTTTPISQWFDANTEAVKFYNPPAERIRRIRVRIRYHNGQFVNFGKFNFSFNLIFNMFIPQNLRQALIFSPTSGVVGGSNSVTKKA